MNSRHWQMTLMALMVAVLLVAFSSAASAFPTYAGCEDCHGGFDGDPYTSSQDDTSWGESLMDCHMPFVNNNCDACHKTGGKKEVFLNFSDDSTLSKSCVGCHGRQEDITGSCTGQSGGVSAECGSGSGLRQMHELNVGSGTCTSCHFGDDTPVGEQTAPFNYGLSGVVMQDSCDGDGTESQFGATGLDNDGDGQRDGSDSDCQVSNTPPIQPGTLSASLVTTSSATVSWGASSDIDGDDITYQVDYRRNGDTPWTSAGSTTTTSRPLSGLAGNQAYDVRITPNDGSVDGPDRTALSLFQTVNTAPTQPDTLSASLVTPSSATVSWGASNDVDGDTITYQVDYRRDGDLPWTSGGSTVSTSRSLSGLAGNQAYDVRITPSDGTDNGPDRTALSLFQTANSAPTQPGTMSASLVTTSSATVSWGASTDSDGDEITYQVDYRRDGDLPWTIAGSTVSTSRSLSDLDGNQAYDVRVTPNDGTENGPDRTALSLFQTVNTAPTQPGTLSASLVTTKSATVSWSASTDVDGDTITYKVEYRRDGDVSWTSAGSTTSTSQSLSDLNDNQAYDVRVTPYDGTDYGPDSTTLKLFQTEIDLDTIFKDSFEGN